MYAPTPQPPILPTNAMTQRETLMARQVAKTDTVASVTIIVAFLLICYGLYYEDIVLTLLTLCIILLQFTVFGSSSNLAPTMQKQNQTEPTATHNTYPLNTHLHAAHATHNSNLFVMQQRQPPGTYGTVCPTFRQEYTAIPL